MLALVELFLLIICIVQIVLFCIILLQRSRGLRDVKPGVFWCTDIPRGGVTSTGKYHFLVVVFDSIADVKGEWMAKHVQNLMRPDGSRLLFMTISTYERNGYLQVSFSRTEDVTWVIRSLMNSSVDMERYRLNADTKLLMPLCTAAHNYWVSDGHCAAYDCRHINSISFIRSLLTYVHMPASEVRRLAQIVHGCEYSSYVPAELREYFSRGRPVLNTALHHPPPIYIF